MTPAHIAELIDKSPMNRGMSGAAWTADERNVAFSENGNVALFDYQEPGVYHAHWLQSVGGREAIEFGKRCLARIFDEYGAEAIFGFTPVEMREARLMARFIGCRMIGETEDEFGRYHLFAMTKETSPKGIN
jgi:hypothetical protein